MVGSAATMTGRPDMNALNHAATLCSVAWMCSAVASANPDALTIADPSPPLTVSSWLKGEPIDGFEEGSVYVVEFWATWCGPCIAGMPHLSDLQRQYEDEVTIIGVNIWERDPSAVPAWMEQRGNELMDYTVAIEEGTTMAEGWMEAAGQRGIPAAFIVDRDGKIAWIGHPGQLDEPLEQVVAGTWDSDLARERHEAKRAEARRQAAIRKAFEERAAEPIAAFRNADSADNAVSAAEQILAMDPPQDVALQYFDQAFMQTAHELKDPERAMGYVREHSELLFNASPAYLVRYAWFMLNLDVFEEARDFALIIELVERAHELAPEDVEIAAMCADVHMQRAIELQRRAVENAADSEREQLEDVLARFERARADGE